jgi:hypothetical protein
VERNLLPVSAQRNGNNSRILQFEKNDTKRSSRIERRCFVYDATKSYVDKQGLEHWHIKQQQQQYLIKLF